MTGARPPLVSVIVPVFNVAEHVAEAIASLRGQTLADFEVLVVDDGSTDGSGDRARAAMGDDARFRMVRQPNGGLSAARNTGLDQARGAFVAFLDGDDAFAPEFLATLHAALQQHGTDWAACGIALLYPDGTRQAHAAMHASPDAGCARRLTLEDARDVARLFPSAWNKLYRRALFDDLRFPRGSWFEDHEVFWALAARSPALAYVPDPLYLHRRARPGQITGTDSDRVFEQLAVLDRLSPQILSSGLTHAAEGYARLATRLVHERALVIREPARRTRFLAESRALLVRHGAPFTPGWDPEISRGLGLMLDGVLPLSVVVVGDPGPALAALDTQSQRDMEIVVVGQRAPATTASGLSVRTLAAEGLTPARLARALHGRWTLLLAPGEVPLPEGAMRLVNLAERLDLPLAMGALDRDGTGYHDGWTDNRLFPGLDAMPVLGGAIELAGAQALRIYPALGNRLLRTDLLARLPGSLPLTGTAAAVQRLAVESALLAGAIGYTRLATARVPDRPARLSGTLATWRALRAAPDSASLPRGWRSTLLFRLVQRRGGTLRLTGAMLLAAFSGWLRVGPGAEVDPDGPRWLRHLVRLLSRRA